jgi:hypothetical protein
MDRQRGWRLALIVWGSLCPFAISAGIGLWGLFLQGSGASWPTLPDVVAYSVIAAMPLAAVAVIGHRARRPRGALIPANRQDRKRLRWTAIGMLMILATSTLNLYAEQLRNWPHIHRVVGAISLLASLSACASLAIGRFGSARSGAEPGQASDTRP